MAALEKSGHSRGLVLGGSAILGKWEVNGGGDPKIEPARKSYENRRLAPD